MKAENITIRTPEGSKEVKAIIISELLAVNAHEDNDYVITHRPTGYALCKGFNKVTYAYVVADRLNITLSHEQRAKFSFTDPAKAPKQLGKKIQKYLFAARRCENNTDMESMVGIFYRDREDTERLRMKINPSANILVDDKAIGSERLTASLIMGDMKLS